MNDNRSRVYAFGPFRLDCRERVLWREGEPVPLAPKAAETLFALVENAGHIVEKAELMQRVWPDAFVEEGNLTKNIWTLRKLLGFGANGREYIDTIPKRGYRFAAAVQELTPVCVGPATESTGAPALEMSAAQVAEWQPAEQLTGSGSNLAPGMRGARPISIDPGLIEKPFGTDAGEMPRLSRRVSLQTIGLSTAAVVILALLLADVLRPPLPPPSLSPAVRITDDGFSKSNAVSYIGFGSDLVTDGANLYFNEYPSNFDSVSGPFKIPLNGGEPIPVPTSLPNPALAGISPDHSALLVLSAPDGVLTSPERELWLLPLNGRPARRLGNIVAHAASFSPDGRRLVYAKGHDIWVANADGTNPHKLVTLNDYAWNIRWSPDGELLRFDNSNEHGDGDSYIWEVHADGSRLRPLLPGWRGKFSQQRFGFWTAGGAVYLFQSLSGSSDSHWDVWAIREKGSLARKWTRAPVRLNWPTVWSSYLEGWLPSADGKRLLVTVRSNRARLRRYDARTGRFLGFIQGISALNLDFSKDGKWIAYVSGPKYALMRSHLDGTHRLRLEASPLPPWGPSWSPDGKHIAFYARRSIESRFRVYVVPADGSAPPREVPTPKNERQVAPDWSPDGTRLALGVTPVILNRPPTETHGVYILDLADGRLSIVPGSRGFFRPRWSPDGQFIAAASAPAVPSSLMLFDVHSGKWRTLATMPGQISDLAWTRNGDGVYALLFRELSPQDFVSDGIFRVQLADGKARLVVRLDGMQLSAGTPLALAPDGSVVVSEDLSFRSEDVYSVGLQVP
jgi:DNA-binding winged helix-turn-helix (wHTH) protein/Tol biopolymer transport system component